MNQRVKLYDRLPGRGRSGPSARTGPFDSGMKPNLAPAGYSPLKNGSCLCWVEADHTELMGRVVDRTVDPYRITTLPNFLDPLSLDGGTFDEAGAARAIYGHLEASNVAREVMTFAGAEDLISSQAAAFWTDSHRVWTWGLAVRMTADGRIIATCNDNALQVGFLLSANSANERLTFRIGDGSGVWVVSHTTANGSFTLHDVHVVLARYSNAFGYDIRVDGASIGAGAMGAPAAGAPANTLNIGIDPGLGSRFDGQVGAIIGFNEVFGVAAGEAGLELEAYLAAKYQNNSVAVSQGSTFWFRMGVAAAWELDEANPAAGHQIDEIWDLGGNAHRGYQATDADQGDARIHDSLFDNEDSIEANGANDNYVVSPGIGWAAHPGTDHSTIMVLNTQNQTVTEIVLDFQTGRMAFVTVSPIDTIGIYDTAYRNTASPTILGSQVLEWKVDDTTNLLTAYRNSILLGTVAVNAAGVSPGGTTRILSDQAAAAGFFDGRCEEMYYRDSLQTALELWEYREELFDLYPQVWGRVPGGEAWWNPTLAGNVQYNATTGRVNQVNDTNYRGNDETQAVGADQPTLVTAADGYLALRSTAANTEDMATGVIANAGAGAIWGWFLKSTALVTQTALGSVDATPDQCAITAVGAGNWQGDIGGSNINSGVAVVANTWVFSCLVWDGTNETFYVDGAWVTQAVGEIPSTRALRLHCRDNNGVLDQYWNGDTGEHGVLNYAPDPYDVAILRRQTTRGGTRETWVAPIIPGHVGWYNPCWGEVVTRSGANRISQVDDGHATVASGAQNNKTQAVGADQPLWVPDAGDGVAAERYDITNTEHMDTGLVPNAAQGTIWGWFKMENTGGSLVAMGCIDGTPDQCFLYKQNASGNWTFAIGGSLINSGIAVTPGTWYFVAGVWDGTNEHIYVSGTLVSQAVGEIPATNSVYTGARNNVGVADLHWDGDIGEQGIVEEALTEAQLDQLMAQTART